MTDDELENAKAKILKDLHSLKDLQKEMDNVLGEPKTEKNGDKEFQVKLAVLQADVQIYLSIGLGLLALTGAFLIGVYQVAIAVVTPDLSFLKELAKYGLFALVIIFAVYAYKSFKKADYSRKEMDKLSVSREPQKTIE
jgi:hypothetical protein